MEFYLKHRVVILFIAFTLFCIISLSIQSSTFTFSVQGVGSALAMPFQKAYDGIQNGISKVWAGFTDLSELRKELHVTRKKLQKYESINEDFTEIKLENNRLRKLIGLKARITYKSIPAAVISKDPDNWFRTLIIDKGSSDGISNNMPVIAFQNGQKAIVGKISEVRGSISRIIPIISPNIRIGVMFQENRFPGLLHGLSSNSIYCAIDYVSKSAIVKSGGVVITSGQGGVFPQGLAVGKVVKAEVLKTSAFQKIIIQPIINYNVIEEVFVIKMKPNKEIMKLLEVSE